MYIFYTPLSIKCKQSETTHILMITQFSFNFATSKKHNLNKDRSRYNIYNLLKKRKVLWIQIISRHYAFLFIYFDTKKDDI